ncbi:hypothetical protein [Pimelobacter simplex]|uniref:hypothetical protein n=1 Tax=Nocardioides simplex TaxID=2045 RepID=UPI003AAC4585
MTGREWQPGDVARVTYYGVDQIALVRPRSKALGERLEFAYVSRGYDMVDDADISGSARPLVVIDPEDREQVERLAAAFVDVYWRSEGPRETAGAIHAMQAALREFASPTPTKPDEPSKWGVVEASCVHSPRRLHWMRHEDDNWWPFAPYGEDDRRPLPDDWDSLVDPVVVRDGVAGEPS